MNKVFLTALVIVGHFFASSALGGQNETLVDELTAALKMLKNNRLVNTFDWECYVPPGQTLNLVFTTQMDPPTDDHSPVAVHATWTGKSDLTLQVQKISSPAGTPEAPPLLSRKTALTRLFHAGADRLTAAGGSIQVTLNSSQGAAVSPVCLDSMLDGVMISYSVVRLAAETYGLDVPEERKALITALRNYPKVRLIKNQDPNLPPTLLLLND